MMTLKDFLNKNDRYAANIGAQLTYVNNGVARAEMDVTHDHLNAGGVCQGGALFTLADLALAAIMNSHKKLTFGIQNNISFLKPAKEGDHLIAEAVETNNHHKIPYCDVKIENQRGELIATLTGLAYRKDIEMTYEGLM